MKHHTTQKLYKYWDYLRGDQSVPSKQHIDPAKIKTILEYLFIIENDDQDIYRYRLAGTGLCALHCRELTGRNFLGSWEKEDQKSLRATLDAVRQSNTSAVIGIDAQNTFGLEINLEMLILPLAISGTSQHHILGSCVAMDRPYWYGMQPIVKQSIRSMRLLVPESRHAKGAPSIKIGKPAPDFISHFAASSRNDRKMGEQSVTSNIDMNMGPNLRVISGGKM